MAVEAIFLNPLPASAMRSSSKAGKRKYKVKSTKLKSWLSLVKKHGGDLKAAAAEKRSRLRGKVKGSRHSASTSRRGGSGSKSGLAARRAASNAMSRGGGSMAARKTKRRTTSRRRRRNQAPPMASWVAKWEKGMEQRLGRKPKAPKFRKVRSKGKRRDFTRQDWTRRLKRGTRKWARSAPKRSFAAKVRSGQRRSAKLRRYAASPNPVFLGDWVSRYTDATGYVPHFTKGARPMSKRWVRRTAKGAKRAGKSKYRAGASSASAGDRWLSSLSRWGRKESRRVTRRAANPKRGRRTMAKAKRRRKSSRKTKSYPLVLRNMMPMARRKRSYKKRSYRRRRNPVGTTLSAMYATPALKKYLYVTGGVAAGAVAPTLLRKGFDKVGVSLPAWSDTLLGIGGAAIAGIGTAMVTKDDAKGVLVAAGGVAGVLAGLILRQLMPEAAPAVAGLGQSAEQALQQAVNRELARAGLSGGNMGQFLTPGEAEALPAPDMGQFLTEPEMQSDIAETGGAVTAGLSQDDLVAAGGSSSFDGIDGSLF